MTVRIINADCREALREMPAESVHCVVTSPPYWGLRDYGVDGAIGLEATVDEHVEAIVEVFREVFRVLRGDGTVWLNYGDAYANDGKWGGATGGKHALYLHGGESRIGREKRRTGLKPKDLILLPARIALALQADGWWLRSDIIWAKPNPMPESITDRPTSAHEHVFLLAKSARYFYDAAAVRESCESGPSDIRKMTQSRERIGGKHKTLDDPLSKASRHTNIGRKRSVGDPSGRNLRNVWTVVAAPFPDAHFATFPPALVEPCIKAGCPEGGTILDPFGGAGTTGLVADRLGRDAILVELNPDYCDMARRRIAGDAPLFSEVAAE